MYTLPINHIINGKYKILEVLGQGGFGITYKVRHDFLQKELCIKELFISGSSTRNETNTVISQTIGEFTFEDFKKRFLDEAKQLARYSHPNIVKVIDVFEENNTAYMVMEYEQGQTLKSLVENHTALSADKAFNIMHQLLDAVEEVHQKNMLHRDIKPDNIIIKNTGNAVLIDFGSARAYGEGKTITQTAMLTPGYAPKEQYSEKAKRGAFTDIYALGATFYFMLTGKKPIAAVDRYEEELSEPHILNKIISSQISSAIMLAMELKPEDRFQTIADFREALNTLANEGKIEKKEDEKNIVSKNNKIETHVTDLDGNKYRQVKIGDQIWLGENLKTTKFQNGEDIFLAQNKKDWAYALKNKIPACAWYQFDENLKPEYGLYYNYYAALKEETICPEGWRIPKVEDFHTLLANNDLSTKKYNPLISKDEKKYKLFSKNIEGSDEYGFSARFGGYLFYENFLYITLSFSFINELFLSWASMNNEYVSFEMDLNNILDYNNAYSNGYGYSIRCIKNQE